MPGITEQDENELAVCFTYALNTARLRLVVMRRQYRIAPLNHGALKLLRILRQSSVALVVPGRHPRLVLPRDR